MNSVTHSFLNPVSDMIKEYIGEINMTVACRMD